MKRQEKDIYRFWLGNTIVEEWKKSFISFLLYFEIKVLFYWNLPKYWFWGKIFWKFLLFWEITFMKHKYAYHMGAFEVIFSFNESKWM